jgi:hypothetical protein
MIKLTTTFITDKSPSLEEAQLAVGGYVELVRLKDGRQVLVNEEGLLQRLPINEEASLLCNRTIVGNALVLSGKAKWK